MPENFTEIIESFLVGAFPWISQFKNLDIHFKIQNFNLKSIYNFFASLFSLSIYLYLKRLDVYDLLYWPKWEFFIIAAFVLILTYFVILIYKRSEVNSSKLKWPIIVNFIIYIFVFSCLTSGFGLLKQYKDHIVIQSNVVDNKNIALKEVSVSLEYQGSPNKNIDQVTDNYGNFSLLVSKQDRNQYKQMILVKEGYNNKEIQVVDIISLKSTLKRGIVMKKLD